MSGFRHDVISAYAASGARIASWAVVSAVVYRYCGAEAFASVALARSTAGLFTYAGLGLGPAMVHELARARPDGRDGVVSEGLTYATARVAADGRTVFSTGFLLACMLAAVVAAVVALMVWHGSHLAAKHVDAVNLIAIFALAVAVKLIADVGGTVLQSNGVIATDNWIQLTQETIWTIAVYLMIRSDHSEYAAATMLVLATLVCGAIRLAASSGYVGFPSFSHFSVPVAKRLLSFGTGVTISQLADFLYAPMNYILIAALLSASALADYAPAVQIDGAMLVLVSGLAAVLLPKSAMAHAAGDWAAVRRYYIRGTLFSLGVLGLTALSVCLLSPLLFKTWLGDSMPGTRAILPLVMVHTVLGGSAMVGRSVLLGMGRVRAFTAAALLAGAANVALAWCLVKYLHWGLKGIVAATITVVTLRCVVWMPWYVTRTLSRQDLATSTSPTNQCENAP